MGNCVSKGQEGEKEGHQEKGHHPKGQGLMIRSAWEREERGGRPQRA